MFSIEEWRTIVDRIMRLTLEEKIRWTSNDVGGYFFDAGDVTYLLFSRDNDGVAPFVLKINKGTDADFETIGVLESDPTSSLDPGFGLFRLWADVVRSANGTPRMYRDILDGLDHLEAGGS